MGPPDGASGGLIPDPAVLVAAFVVTILAVALQRVVGIGMAIISVPILALLDPVLAPVPQTLISVPMVLYMAWHERRSIELASVRWILVGRLPGALLGLWVITVLDGDALAVAMGVLVMLAAIVVWRGVAIRRRRPISLIAGIVSGFMALVAAIGGPPLALLYRNSPPATVRSSLAAVFAFGVIITIIVRGTTGNISGDELRVATVLLPAVPLGLVVGGWAAPRVKDATLRNAVLILAIVASIGLIGRTLLG